MAMTFRFLPGERLNEAVLAKELGVSRTPLREALNRLSTEGFLTFSANNGFFRKTIDVKEIFDLYEFRMYLELSGVKLAVERATDEQLTEIEDFLTESAREVPTRTVDDLVLLDEQFHEMLMKLTGNVQMLDSLRNINARIQFVRWLDMTDRRSGTQSEHKHIVAALRKRDRKETEGLISEHIAHRLDQIVEKVERSYGRIFVRNQQIMQ
jgi:DNA-binding GntR family transcriptional regulator